MSDHRFRARLHATSASDADDAARRACAAYFGDLPYTYDITTTGISTFSGEVRGYQVDVDAVLTEPAD